MRMSDLTTPTAPCFAPAPRDRRAEFGCPVQFMCRPVGCPPPTVKWYRQGEEMGDTGRAVRNQSMTRIMLNDLVFESQNLILAGCPLLPNGLVSTT